MFCAFYTATIDLADVKRELAKFGKWRELGRNLGLSNVSLEVINADYMMLSKRLEEVLFEWLRRNYNVDMYGLPSWSRLADALQPIDMALAFKIKERQALEPQPQSKNSMYVCFDLF